MEGLNVSVFKYPLGFIRVLQFIFIVIALCAANSWRVQLDSTCPSPTTTPAKPVQNLSEITTTFSMSSHEFTTCAGERHTFWEKSWGGAAGFFYFTHVISLIFVLIATFSYVVFWPIYTGDKRIPLADLAVTALLFVFWFFCTSIWWAAANGIGEETSESHVKTLMTDKNIWGELNTIHANNGMLAISVLCGWVCVGTFALNCWFIWKEVVPRPAENPTQIA